jgi:hypothetical protein
LAQVGRDNAQELFEKAREWFVNRPIAISRQIREMIAAAHRPPSVAQERGDTFLTGMESGEEDNDDGDLFILPQTSHGAGNAAEADVLPPLPPIGDPRRRSRHSPRTLDTFISRLKFLFLPPFPPFYPFIIPTPSHSNLQRASAQQIRLSRVRASAPPSPPPRPPQVQPNDRYSPPRETATACRVAVLQLSPPHRR